jgi:guanylate kinase
MKIILSGPSGAGKDTLIDMWAESNPRIKRAITATTRAPRPGEVDGVSYHFYTIEEMKAKIANNEFLEHMNVFGNIYGTPRSSVDEIVAAGDVAIIRIDVQGAIELIPKMPDAVSIFILPPSLEELRRRIEGRKTDTPEKIEERMDTAIAEIMCSYFYDHQIVNDDINVALSGIEGILSGKTRESTELADECMNMLLNQRTIERIEKFLALADESGISSKNPQNVVDKK